MPSKTCLDADLQAKIRSCIKAFLNSRGMTEADLAEKMGLKVQTVWNYLARTELTAKTVKKFSDALSYPYDLLIEGEPYAETARLQDLEKRVSEAEKRLDFLEGILKSLGMSFVKK